MNRSAVYASCRVYFLILMLVSWLPAISFQSLCGSPSNYGGNFPSIISHYENTENTSFYVKKITYSSDVEFSNHEFLYLTGLQKNSFITKLQVDKAYNNLMAKRRFHSIDIDIHDDGEGKHLHFTLHSKKNKKKLEFEGVWFGKPRYATFYTQQPGDVFDSNLHDESIKAIQEYLHDQGYFNAQVIDEILYSKRQKTITVRIKIAKKNRFTIKNILVVINDIKKIDNGSDLIESLRRRLKSSLKDTYYSKKHLIRQFRKVRNIVREQGFASARFEFIRKTNLTRSTANITLTVDLGKRKAMSLLGNTVFNEDEIKKQFIGKDVPDWLYSSDIIAQQLLYEYYKKGYWATRITPKQASSSSFSFAIEEGTPAIIENVVVVDSVLHIPERSGSILNEVLKDKICDQALLDTCLNKLQSFYQSNGYWDFVIVDKRFEKNKATGNYEIKILINKGIQRIWGGFSIDVDKELEAHEFFKKYTVLKSTQHVPFNINWLQEQRNFLANHYYKCGYWYADLQPQLTEIPHSASKNQSTTQIFVTWKIQKGPQVVFGKTVLRGTTTIDFKKIQQQCSFKDGDAWDRKKIEQTRKKLKQLDVFKTVQIQPYQLAKNKGKKPVVITLVDDDPVELRMRAGYFINSQNNLFHEQSTPKLGASFIIKNPSNRADKLSLAGDWSRYEQTASLYYQQPSPWDIPAMFSLEGFVNKFIHPVEIQNSARAYEALQYGLLAGFKNQYKNNYYWSVNFGNEWHKITDVHGNIKFDPQLINKTLPYFYIQPTLKIDKLDNALNTTKGTFTNIDLKLLVPEDNGEAFAKLVFEESVFYPAYEKIIIAARLRVGHIFRRKFEKVLPNERFYLGGPDSVRGYEPDALPPLGVSYKIVNGIPMQQLTV